MNNVVQLTFMSLLFIKIHTKDVDLPLCPTSFQFLPQPLPMHCRMPNGKVVSTMPMQGGMPGLPGMMPMPLQMSGGMQMMPGPVPMPAPPPMPGSKLPVIVMPIYSNRKNEGRAGKDSHRHERGRTHNHHHRHSDSNSNDAESSDTDNSDSDSDEFWNERRRRMSGHPGKKRGNARRMKNQNKKHNADHNLLTPVLQYMTKDGYVVFEKKISKGEAKDWLDMTKDKNKNESLKTPEVQTSKKEKRHNKLDEYAVREDDKSDNVGNDEIGFRINSPHSKPHHYLSSKMNGNNGNKINGRNTFSKLT